MTARSWRSDLLRLLRRGRLTRADRPDRLVGHDDVGAAGDAGQRGLQLGDRHGARPVRLEVFGGLADADDRHEPVRERRRDLVADDLSSRSWCRSRRSEWPMITYSQSSFARNAPRDLAGVRAGVVRRHVLRAERERELVGGDQRLHRAQVGEGREDGHLDGAVVVLGVLQAPGELLHERDRLQVVEVHLPVARDERGAPATARVTAIRGPPVRGAACPRGIRGWHRRRSRCVRTGRPGIRAGARRRRSRRRRRR